MIIIVVNYVKIVIKCDFEYLTG